MKKKISLFMLCGVILLSLCGCDNQKEDTIKGKYSQTDITGGSLTLYENGSCNWIHKFDLYGNTNTVTYSSDECSYDYIDNEITLNYIMYKGNTSGAFKEKTYNATCSYNNGTIDCGDEGVYEK